MSIIGWILMLAGAAVAGLIFVGLAPAALVELPVPLWGWIALSVLGLLIVFFTRRPGD